MRVLMVLDHEFPSDVRVENEAIALIEAGYEVHLACYTRKKLPEKDIFKGIIIHRAEISKFIYKSSVAALTFPTYFRFWYKFLDNIISINQIEAIHIHDLPLSFVGKRIKDKHNIKLTVDLHENWAALLNVSTHTKTLLGRILSPIFLWKAYEKRILKFADSVIVVVDEAKERLINLGIDSNKISIVSNTLNKKEFGVPDLNPDPNYFTLYYAGGINYHRGLQTVISALPIVTRTIKNVRLRIAGSGSYTQNLIDLANSLGVSGYVEFLGHISLNDVAINLAKSNAALIPHLKTDHTDSTIPHKLFQYMYINKPIIASNCLPIERIINETKAGVIFKSGSVEDLAAKIISLASNEIQILPAQHWVDNKYNWSYDSKVLVNTYKTLLSK